MLVVLTTDRVWWRWDWKLMKADLAADLAMPRVWETILKRLRAGLMWMVSEF